MARRRTKNRSRTNAEARDTRKGARRTSESSGVSVLSETKSSETPTVDQEETKSNTDATSKDQARTDRVAETLANVERLLSQTNENSSANTPDWSQTLEVSLKETQKQLSSQLEQFTQSFEKQFNELQQSISKRLDDESIARTNAQTDQSSNDAEAEAFDDSESDWERRKRKMYADHGEALPATKNKSEKAESANELEGVARPDENSTDGTQLDSLQESLHDSIESLDTVQAEEIEELRAQLTEKLREAEVELSINRAKLDQRNAELERQQTELERREKSFASKYADVDGTPQKKGVLDRLTRHLGVRKKVDSL